MALIIDWRCQTLQMNPTRKAVRLLAVLSLLGLSLDEWNHLFRYGHLVPLGLHADICIRKGDIGIEGISKLYAARLTNYGIFPRRVSACDFVTDASSEGTMVTYAVQRWDTQLRRWETLAGDDKSSFCRPYPLGIAQARLFTKLLWPFQSILTAEEATAARGGLIGDSARFSIFSDDTRDWRNAFPTPPFRIDELPTYAPIRHVPD